MVNNTVPAHPIIIFDGVCNFCDGYINFVMDHEQSQRLKFAPFQSEIGRKILRSSGINPDQISTLYFYEEGVMYEKSTAVLRIIRYLNSPWNWAYSLVFIPRFLRDIIYSWIAKNRYKFFGMKEACRIPTLAEKSRFLS